jgi:hypothetical protein
VWHWGKATNKDRISKNKISKDEANGRRLGAGAARARTCTGVGIDDDATEDRRH